jgi:hypothetical protein
MTVSPSASHIWQDMPEKVNELEPTRGLQKKQHSPKVAVLASIPRLPVQNGQNVGVEKTGQDRQHARNKAELRPWSEVVEYQRHQEQWDCYNCELRQTNQNPELVRERVHVWFNYVISILIVQGVVHD